jgi:hypothetical protein
VPVAIFYPTAATHAGLPDAIIYVEGARDFLSILQKHFHELWNEADDPDEATPAGAPLSG